MSTYHPTTTERGRNRSRLDRERDLKPSTNERNKNNNAFSNPRTNSELDLSNSQSEFELISDVEDSLPPVIQLDSRGRERNQGFKRGRSNNNLVDALQSRTRGDRNSNRESLALGSISSRLRTTTFDLDFDEEAEEGDTESSAAERDTTRGRGRSRKREEDPIIKRSMLEDALRSSLVTLLAFSPHQSQSFASLTTLFSPTIVSPMIISPASHSRPLSRNGTFTSVLSVLGGLQEEVEEKVIEYSDNEDRIEEYMRKEWEEETSSAESLVQVDLSSSSESISSSADGTQVASNPYSENRRNSYPHSRNIPFASTSYLEPTGSNSLPNPTISRFSPTTSRNLETSDTSLDGPTGWSQRRRKRRSVSRLGSSNSRGRARSVSPGPASNEERFRAREKAKERMMTDVEDAKVEVERDEEFQELVGAARNFMNMSTRTTSSSITSTSTITTKNNRSNVSETMIDTFSTSSSSNSQAPTDSVPTGLSKLSKMILDENNLLNVPTASILNFTPTPYTLSMPSTASLPLSDPYPIDLSIPFSSDEAEFSDDEGLERKKLLGNEEELQADSKAEKETGIFQRSWKTFSRWWEKSFELVKVWHLFSVTSVVACVGLGAGPIIRAATHLMSSFPSLVT